MNIINLGNGCFIFKSQSKDSTKKEYFVDTNKCECDCDDFMFRKAKLREQGQMVECKHLAKAKLILIYDKQNYATTTKKETV